MSSFIASFAGLPLSWWIVVVPSILAITLFYLGIGIWTYQMDWGLKGSLGILQAIFWPVSLIGALAAVLATPFLFPIMVLRSTICGLFKQGAQP